jgi:hypothetical protein
MRGDVLLLSLNGRDSAYACSRQAVSHLSAGEPVPLFAGLLGVAFELSMQAVSCRRGVAFMQRTNAIDTGRELSISENNVPEFLHRGFSSATIGGRRKMCAAQKCREKFRTISA